MFRFTIRDVLWLTVVVGLMVGWWLDHRRAAARDSAWRECFQTALNQFASHATDEPERFDSPIGVWEIHCTVGAHPPVEH